MHLLYYDESNLQEKAGDFFTYAGLVIPGDNALAFSKTIDDLRAKAKLPPGYPLKFNPRPDRLTHEQFKLLKRAVIQAAVHHKATILCSVILHDIATSPDDARRNEINRVCYHFNCLLNRRKDHGLVLIDRFTDVQIDQHLVDKFSVGLRGMPFSARYRLDNLVGFHYSSVGQAHFPSVVDIILGSFRYAVNAATRGETGKLDSAAEILELLSPLFFREPGAKKVSELSMFFSPKAVRLKKYLTKYEKLHAFLTASGVAPAQQLASR